MSVKLHQSAYEYGQKLIRNRQRMLDLREDWTDHKPARSAANRFIKEHGFAAFGKWYLGRGRRGSRTQQAALQVSAWATSG
jgi:hypothetical protein